VVSNLGNLSFERKLKRSGRPSRVGQKVKKVSFALNVRVKNSRFKKN